jgi:hypothetical protein
VDSATQITITSNTANTTGSITFDVGGATDNTANGGGITLKGTTDKTLTWSSSTSAWTSSENFALASGKTLTVNGNTTLAGGSLTFSGAISAPAWTTSGIRHVSVAATLTDTTSSGTVAAAYTNNFGGNTIAATNATTYTNYATVFLNAPTAGTNVTITNPYSLITAGAVLLGGDLNGTSTQNLLNTVSTTVNAFGAATTINIGAASGATTNLNGILAIKGSSSGSVKFQAAAAAGSATYTLPSADGTSSQALVTNGSGTLSWATIAESTSVNKQVNSLGVGTAGSAVAGEIRATNAITSYYSDDRLKTRLGKIENALDKICALEGFYYEANETAQALGYDVKREVGVSAQSTQRDMAEIVKPAPVDEQYLTVQYEKFAPYIIEAIKELRAEVQALKDSK